MTDESFQSEINRNLELDKANSSASSVLFTSKIHQFENLPEPRNATEEELEAFHSKSYDFNIPNNLDDFNKSSNKNDDSMMSNINSKTNSDKLSKVFRKLQINDETMQQTKEPNVVNYNDEIYNNPNLHSEVQN
ncbi:unnamed protein product [Rhizophagus irregularis]|uniref:Uncharacterized protein n=1 Tax=Rhizophagus irregularis TaxID=588596 RepID=A0A916EHX8_9GLOM|nr:unnamed protein product [Rhizophagus irregularis]CAB5214499.1 unnamed protein product [Rhizophagus irregularis]CAB5384033.1 unnamed protein product [Rhizophagus irregularis]